MGWTDFHDDWSSAEALMLSDDSLLDAVLAAIAERRQFFRFVVTPPNRTDSIESIYDSWEYVMDAIDQMIGGGFYGEGFVDTTYNDGDLNNSDAIPRWTKATLAAAAGLESYPTLSKLNPRSAEFVHQMYLIINLLTVYRRNGRNYAAQTSQKDGEDTTWAGAVADFNGNPWGAWVDRTPGGALFETGFIVNHLAGNFDGSEYGISRNRAQWLANSITPVTPYPDFPPPADLSYELKMYATMGYHAGGVFTHTYINPDYLTVENRFGLFYEAPAPDSGAYGPVVTFGNFDNNTLPQPPNLTRYSWEYDTRSSGDRNDQMVATFDFGVANGFEFVTPA